MQNNQKITIKDDNGKEYTYFLYPYENSFREKFSKIRNQAPNTYFDFADIFGVRKSKNIDKANAFVKDLVRELEITQIENALLKQQLNELYEQNVEELIQQDVLHMLNDPKCESTEQILKDDFLFEQIYGFSPSNKTIKGEKQKIVLGGAKHYKTDKINGFTLETLDNQIPPLNFNFRTTICHKNFSFVTLQKSFTLHEALNLQSQWIDYIKSHSYIDIINKITSDTGVKI